MCLEEQELPFAVNYWRLNFICQPTESFLNENKRVSETHKRLDLSIEARCNVWISQLKLVAAFRSLDNSLSLQRMMMIARKSHNTRRNFPWICLEWNDPCTHQAERSAKCHMSSMQSTIEGMTKAPATKAPGIYIFFILLLTLHS